MAGLVPAIHDLTPSPKDVDARVKPGHDNEKCGESAASFLNVEKHRLFVALKVDVEVVDGVAARDALGNQRRAAI